MKKIELFNANCEIYNLKCRPVDLEGTSANLLGCQLAPGQSSEAHNHFENEVFIFTDGAGAVTDGRDTVAVGPGDAVVFDRFENHIITNTSADELLRFHSVYWPSADSEKAETGETEDASVIIFSTPPTPNGDLHLGHLSGPYLAGDTLRRAYKRSGLNAFHLTGRDDHQSYVVTKAFNENRAPEKVASDYAKAIQDTWSAYGIQLDGFITPDKSGPYADFVRAGIRRLMEKNYIAAMERPALFDGNGRYLHEAHVRGVCPYCGESSDGNACESCGRPNDCVELRDALVRQDGGKPHTAPLSRLYFRPSAFSEDLAQYVKSSHMPAHVADLCLSMIDDGLPDICISHPGDWGIPYEIEGYETHTVYVWFEMAFGYLWAASSLPEASGGDTFKKAASIYNSEKQIAHCYGFDNAYYHTMLFPAVYMALGLKPPQVHIVNELLDLDGSKFSTSRNHLIWGRDFVADMPADYARFALLYRRPEGTRSNFVVKDVFHDLNSLFASDLKEWLAAFQKLMLARDGQVPEPGAWLADQKAYYNLLEGHAKQLSQSSSLEHFSPRMIADVIAQLIREGANFQKSQDALFAAETRSAENYRRTALALNAAALRLLMEAALIITPELGERLADMLNARDLPPVRDGGLAFFNTDHALALGTKFNLPPARMPN